MNSDYVTSVCSLTAAIAGCFHEAGIFPKQSALVSALAIALWGWYTNKGVMPHA